MVANRHRIDARVEFEAMCKLNVARQTSVQPGERKGGFGLNFVLATIEQSFIELKLNSRYGCLNM